MTFLLIATLTSMLLAAIMSAIAWRLAGDERRRSEARVAALSAEIHDGAPIPVPILAQAGASRCADVNFLGAEPRPASTSPAYGNLFDAPPRRRSPMLAVLGSGALVVAAAAVAIVGGGMLGRAPRAPAASAPAARELELVALGHERLGDQLTVRGVVRNPPSGAGMPQLTAVVLLFTPDGGFLESGRAPVEAPALRPGGESSFAVTVPRAADVGRYRVSFRTEDHVIPHLDRRHES